MLFWIEPQAWKFEDGRKNFPVRRSAADSLPPGKYAVTAAYEHPAGHRESEKCPYWHGRISTGQVDIEVLPKGRAKFLVYRPRPVNDDAAARTLVDEYLRARGSGERIVSVENAGGSWHVFFPTPEEEILKLGSRGVAVSKKTGHISGLGRM